MVVTLADRGRLWVRKPGWLEWQQLVLSAGSPGSPVAFAQVGEWAVTEPLAAHTAVAVEVPQVEQSHEEWIYWQRYRMTFAGDTIVAVVGAGGEQGCADDEQRWCVPAKHVHGYPHNDHVM